MQKNGSRRFVHTLGVPGIGVHCHSNGDRAMKALCVLLSNAFMLIALGMLLGMVILATQALIEHEYKACIRRPTSAIALTVSGVDPAEGECQRIRNE
jgi:hypothetical protein